MVRIVLWMIIVLLLFISCKRKLTEEYDYETSYVNYSNSTIYPFNMDSLFEAIAPDSLNVTDFIDNAEKKPLCNSFAHYVETKDYTRMEIDTCRINYAKFNYFACGRLNLKHDVVGYLVLRKSVNEMSRDWSYTLMLLNIKNNQLKSLVVTSYNGLTFPATIMQKNYINQVGCRFLITNIAADGIDNNNKKVNDFWSRIGLLKPKNLKYYYVSFTLDENGFVKTIPLDEDKFPKYLK